MDNLKEKVFRGFFWKFGERLIVQIVQFIVSMVIARLVAPENFGMVAIVTIFTNIANVFITCGFSSALIQKQDADDLDFSTMFYCSFAISLILYVVLFFSAPLIATFYKIDQLKNVIRVFALTLPISSYNSIQNAYVSKHMDFKKNFISSFIGCVVSGSIGIIMALKDFGVWALIAQIIVSYLCNCITMTIMISWKPKLMFSLNRAKSMLKYGANVLGADLIGTIFNQANSFIMGKKYSAADLAYYNRGQSFPYLINGNISSIISSVMFPAFSTESNDNDKIKAMAKKTNTMSAFITCPLYFGMMAVSYNLIYVLLTEKWIESVPFMIIICFSCILGTMSPTDLQILKAVGRSDIVFKLEFIKKPIWLGLIIGALFINVYALAFVLPIVSIVEMVINGIVIKKIISYSIREKVKDWGISIFPSVLMFIPIVLLNLLPINRIILLILQIVLGVIIYILISKIFKNECYIELLSIVKQKRKGSE